MNFKLYIMIEILWLKSTLQMLIWKFLKIFSFEKQDWIEIRYLVWTVYVSLLGPKNL